MQRCYSIVHDVSLNMVVGCGKHDKTEDFFLRIEFLEVMRHISSEMNHNNSRKTTTHPTRVINSISTLQTQTRTIS